MNTKAKPTLGPLRVDGLTIEGPDGNVCLMNLARDEEQTKAYAVFIVRACNAHDELVEALNLYVSAGIGNSTDFATQSLAHAKAIYALAKAKGEA